MKQVRQPGDVILDKYMPDADSETRERARENLYALARAMLRIAIRRAHEECGQLDSHEDEERGTIPNR